MNVRRNEYVVEQSITLDKFLSTYCLFISRLGGVAKALQEKLVLVNECVVTSSIVLEKDDVVVLLTSQLLEPDVDRSFSIVYEDDYLLVVNKPANLPVHPAGIYYFNTLKTLLNKEVFFVNRLDKETSGLVLCAKTKELAALLQKSNIEKTYVAITFNSPELKQGVIEKPLKKKLFKNIRDHMRVDDAGKLCKTEYEVVQSSERFSLLKLTLHSGRRHQIRAHLFSIGCPIVGDKQYGLFPELFVLSVVQPSTPKEVFVEKLLAERQLLHASELCFIHPVTKEKLFVSSDLPNDMLDFLNKKIKN